MNHAFIYSLAPGERKSDPWVTGLPGKGRIPAEYLVIGLAPSTKRPKNRMLEPFGSTSWELVQKLRQSYPSMYVTNLVKEPLEPGKKAGKRLIARWLPSLLREIELVDPERILCLGDQVAKTLLPGFTSLREDHGTLFSYEGRVWVPTYHFTAARRNPALKPLLQRDLERFFTLPDPVAPEYVLVSKPSEIPLREKSTVVLDIETTGVGLEDTLTLLGLRSQGVNYIMVAPAPSVLVSLSHRLKEAQVRVLGHNLVFGLSFLLRITDGEWETDLTIEDSMSLAYTEGHLILALKHLTTTLTDLPGSRFSSVTQDPVYLAGDLESTEQVFSQLKGEQKPPYVYTLLTDLAPIIARMKHAGVYVNRETLDRVGTIARHQSVEARAALEEAAGVKPGQINFASSKQVITLLQEHKVPLEKNRAGNPSAAEKVLLHLVDEYPLVKALLDYRASDKLVTGFVLPYQVLLKDSPYLHPTMMIHSTRTGRLSCRNPNLQQVPREGPLKEIFESRWEGGSYGLIDFSQAELRVAALVSRDKDFLQALLGPDVHRYIASLCFQKKEEDVTSAERKASKKITFGLLYGGSNAGLASRAGLPVQRVEKIVKVFFSKFPRLAEWFEEQRYQAITEQRVTTVFGRVRDLTPELLSEGPSGAYRKAVNTPIQSLASDCMLVVLRTVYGLLEKYRFDSRPIFGVHDSLLLDVAPGEEEAVGDFVQEGFRSLWETPIATELPDWKKLPLTGEFLLGPTWASVESTNAAYNPTFQLPCSSH